jgi:DNA-binding NtrC family response regulator
VADETASLVSRRDAPAGGAPSWYLAVALDTERPFAAGLRVALEGSTSVSVGRGDARAVTRAGPALRVDLEDPYQSREQFRLTRDARGWRLEDAGSKNGTRLGGVRTPLAPLADGDVIEAGATLMVIRETWASAPDRQLGPDLPAALRTLHAPLEAELAVIAKLAPTSLPILVRGESGSGKELAARAVHELSGRRGPLVAVNCGSLPAAIAEAELFGARRGAFSGAVEDRPGLIQTAAGGTLFLDEIADLPLPAQAALLRLLQEGELRQLGAHRTDKIDVRVLAATHRDLDALVAREAFRGDLLARLRGHVLTLPPLRARREDLGILYAELLGTIEGRQRPERTLEPAAARALFAYDWPGNVRELEQSLRVATAQAAGEIALADLPESVRAPRPAPGARPIEGEERRALVVRLLEQHAGNLTAVARALGTSRSQLRRLAERFGIDLGRSKK